MALPLAGAVALLAGCAGGAGAPSADVLELDPAALVLDAADLPAGLDVSPVSSVPVTADLAASGRFAANPQQRAQDFVRWGRLRGFVQEFDNSGQPNRMADLFLSSEAEVYRSVDGASKALAAQRQDIASGFADSLQVADLPGLGDESVAFRLSPAARSAGDRPVDGYLLLWRRGPVLAFLRVSLSGGELDRQMVLRLAQLADGRVAEQLQRGPGTE